MRIAAFSDTHLTTRFQEDRFNYLASIIKNHEMIIINGDLWEGQMISFDQFLSSEWSKLFPLLKNKKTVYIYGNHDKASMMDERYYDFCDEVHDEYDLTLDKTGEVLHFIHGHQFTNYPFTYYRTHPKFLKAVSYPNLQRLRLEDQIGKKMGWGKQEKMRVQKDNIKFFKIAEEKYPGKILVTSHFHYPVFEPEQKYINTGLILFHVASYLTIDDGNMSLVKERY